MNDINKKYAHAYIIEGAAGKARSDYLKNLAMDIICSDTGLGEADNARLRIANGTHEDLFFMERTGKETYRVDDAAALIERLRMRPYGNHKVGIIDNAERMSETVQNKLLKTLEEPYPGTVILLATENREALLPTVRSRCVLLRLDDNDNKDENTDEVIGELLRLWHEKKYFFKIRELTKKSFRVNENALNFLDVLETNFRDRLLADGVISPNTMQLLKNIDDIEVTREAIKRGMNPEYALDSLYLRTK